MVVISVILQGAAIALSIEVNVITQPFVMLEVDSEVNIWRLIENTEFFSIEHKQMTIFPVDYFQVSSFIRMNLVIFSEPLVHFHGSLST